LDTILRNVERMATLVYDLLDLCRLESGQVQMEAGPVSLHNAVDEVVVAMRPQLDAKKMALNASLVEDLPYVLADARRLNQILANLVDNACKYTPEGGRISIRARFLPPPQSNPQRYPKVDKGYAEVSVQDTGIGIASQDLERIFERFVRLDNPLVEQAGGTGLGLTIVQQLLLLQGGQVWVESTLGQGSTFTFSLPVAEENLG
jgi:signal transduction histidine kinase